MRSINPATGEEVQRYDVLNSEGVERSIEQAHEAQLGWSREAYATRARYLNQVSVQLLKEKDAYAQLISQEMGKPLKESVAEIEKSAWVCRYYAQTASDHLKDKIIETDATESYIHYEPMGLILAVMPWNFPFWQVFRFAAPALMAGNGALLKHASNVPGCGIAIEQIFRKAGLPAGLFSNLLVKSDQVEAVIRDDRIAAVTLTGSEQAGASVASIAGSEIKKSVLELGGSDPYIILEDADLTKAADICAESRMRNAGQSCIAAKRLIVVEEVYDAFIEALIKNIRNLRWGDPLNEDTDIGPMAKAEFRDEIHTLVQESIAQGAQCVTGGAIPDHPGFFYPPTLLIDVKPGMPVYEQETFGPVACVIKAQDEAHALRLAAQTSFGLGAAVFTGDIARGKRIAESGLVAGSCFVNTLVRSDPRLPFGGIKKSGYGRELSALGIQEFVNAKTIYIA